MALDLLEWIIIAAVLLGLVLGGVGLYFLLRVLRTLNKADRYFDEKEKESRQPAKSS